jgi:hypothetical protein
MRLPSGSTGVGKSGSCGLPSVSVRLQRFAISREAAHAAGVGERLALGDAHARLVRVEVVGLEELHRVRGHHRQPQLGRQRHRGAHVGLVGRQAGALQLEVEAARKQPREMARDRRGAAGVTCKQRRTDGTAVGPRQRDQTAAELGQPLPLDPGLRALDVGRPRAREQFAQVQVAAAVLHQHEQPARLLVACRAGHEPVGQRLHPQVGAEDRLDTRAAARLVELDRTEQVREVRQRQRRLTVGPRRGGGIVDAQRAVDDRVFAVQAQVDERHRGHCRQPHPRGPKRARRAALHLRPR